MSLFKHPNVLRVRGSWMNGHKLYIAMRLMNRGSAADVMRYGWQGGFEEEVIKCILKQALKGLNYLHINGFIHRDIKAANLLIDDDGTVLLGDLGVAADLSEDSSEAMDESPAFSKTQPEISSSSWSNHSGPSSDSSKRTVESDILVRPKMGKRKSFVGTPCWMAPELIQGKHYDFAADIWSFGITTLELSLGRPPRSRESPQKVLLRTVREAPPTLDRDGGEYKYSRAFQEFVEACLVKDPSKRPTAEQLLQSSFLKGAKKPSYLISKIFKDLPPLAQRQESRVLPNSQTRVSIESWDFATTVHSLPPSFSTKCLSQETALDNDELLFEVDLDRNLTSPRSHFRSVSFAEQNPVTEGEAVLMDPRDSSNPSPFSQLNALSTSDNDAIDDGQSSSTSSPCMTPPSRLVQFSEKALSDALPSAIDVTPKLPHTDIKPSSSPHETSRRMLSKLSRWYIGKD
ncbi:hypothetical protein E1B28_001371 [Marasmius oreades]|nr:uncharacterized protein E1B28_001371 [Marasmius oreades]KAG7099531.1 hypothetical protein E1B28_001371 [Marasmius oreades]